MSNITYKKNVFLLLLLLFINSCGDIAKNNKVLAIKKDVEANIYGKNINSFKEKLRELPEECFTPRYTHDLIINCLRNNFSDGLGFFINDKKIKGPIRTADLLIEVINSRYYSLNMSELEHTGFLNIVDIDELCKYAIYGHNFELIKYLIRLKYLSNSNFKAIIMVIGGDIHAIGEEGDIYKNNNILVGLSILDLFQNNFTIKIEKNEASMFLNMIWPRLSEQDKKRFINLKEESAKQLRE